MAEEKEPQDEYEKYGYTKPTSLLDLEDRQKDDYVPPGTLVGDTDVSPLNRGGFIGVDPVYQNAANETERPFNPESGPEAKAVEHIVDREKNKWRGDEALPEVDPEDDPLVNPQMSVSSTGVYAAPMTEQPTQESDTDKSGATTEQPTQPTQESDTDKSGATTKKTSSTTTKK